MPGAVRQQAQRLVEGGFTRQGMQGAAGRQLDKLGLMLGGAVLAILASTFFHETRCRNLAVGD